MKKITLLSTLLFAGTFLSANPQSLQVVFSGNDHANWTTANSSSFNVGQGHLSCEMALNGSKYRGDLQFNGSNNASVSFTLNPQKDCYLAVKFIGQRPDGKLKMEFNDGAQWYNTKWNGGTPASILTSGGNTIYYFKLTDDDQYTGESVRVQRMNLIIADAVEAPLRYAVDWISTFSTLQELEASRDWKDDGDGDEDEKNIQLPAVQNKRSMEGYSTLAEAVSVALSEDTLLIHKDLAITNRIDITSKVLTLIAPAGEVCLQRSGSGIMLLSKGAEAKLTIGGIGCRIILDGMNQLTASPFVEINDAGTVELRGDVLVRNCQSTNLYGTAICNKNSGQLLLEDVMFENCRTLGENGNELNGYGVVFVGSNGTQLNGNNRFVACGSELYVEHDYAVKTGELTHEQPIGIILSDPQTRVRPEVVLDCPDLDKFKLINDDFSFVSNGQHLEFSKDTANGLTDYNTSSIKIYGGKAQISVVTDSPFEILIYAYDGKCVVNQNVNRGEAIFTGLTKGLYLVNGRKVVVE